MIGRTLADALSVVPFAFVRVCYYASVLGRSLSRLWSWKDAGSSEGSMWMKNVVFPCRAFASSPSSFSERS